MNLKKIVIIILIILFVFSAYGDEKEKRWVICIGINDYSDTAISDLDNARKDAKDLAKVLTEYGDYDYIFVMTDDINYRDVLFPSKVNIEDKIKSIGDFAEKKDLIVISFSGHGITDENGDSYLITVDSKANDLYKTSVKLKDIIGTLESKGLSNSVLILDACREKIQKTKGMKLKGLTSTSLKNKISAVLYSTKKGLYSYEDEESENGVFTRFMIEGLKGNADYNKDKNITYKELTKYVEKSVADWSIKNNKKQKPYSSVYDNSINNIILTTSEKQNTADMEAKNLELNKWITNELNMKEKQLFQINTKKGVEYEIYIVDKYNANYYKDKKVTLDAAYFQVRDDRSQDSQYPKKIYRVWKDHEKYKHGGYSYIGKEPAAKFIAKDDSTYIFLNAAKKGEYGKYEIMIIENDE